MSTLLTHEQFKTLCREIYSNLESNESLSMALHGEETRFMRFNKSKLRQATNVTQLSLTLGLQREKRELEYVITIGADHGDSRQKVLATLTQMRDEIVQLPEDPFFVAHRVHPSSHTISDATLADLDELEALFKDHLGAVDLAGIYVDGPMIKGLNNSQGLDHWFEARSFSFDYSLFEGKKAVKGGYAGTRWSTEDFLKGIESQKKYLEWLRLPQKEIAPGSYRTYLEPAAAQELVSMLGWGGFSYGLYKRGQSSLGKLYDGTSTLSKSLTLKESFSNGLVPPFNDQGEPAPKELTLIDKGVGKNQLINSRTAVEHDQTPNGANSSESFRSVTIEAGELNRDEVLKELDTGLFLSNLHYLNYSDMPGGRVTGMTRYACFWVEKGKIIGPIKDLRFDESLYKALGSELIAVTKEREIFPNTSTYFSRDFGAMEVPGMLLESMTFTL